MIKNVISCPKSVYRAIFEGQILVLLNRKGRNNIYIMGGLQDMIFSHHQKKNNKQTVSKNARLYLKQVKSKLKSKVCGNYDKKEPKGAE